MVCSPTYVDKVTREFLNKTNNLFMTDFFTTIMPFDKIVIKAKDPNIYDVYIGNSVLNVKIDCESHPKEKIIAFRTYNNSNIKYIPPDNTCEYSLEFEGKEYRDENNKTTLSNFEFTLSNEHGKIICVETYEGGGEYNNIFVTNNDPDNPFFNKEGLVSVIYSISHLSKDEYSEQYYIKDSNLIYDKDIRKLQIIRENQIPIDIFGNVQGENNKMFIAMKFE